ncbi:MAG: glutamate 5-kinase [Deltaproteobacteria bacterium]|nr:glutamate 5-kinase [Deltaproteobacteria bacterium]
MKKKEIHPKDSQALHALLRTQMGAAKRVVVKVGTRVLVQRSGRPDEKRLIALVDQISRASRDRQVVLVSSGAIGAGMEALGIKRRPKTIPALQMAAAVGQTRLMTRYDQLFAARGQSVGQVLLTHDDLKDRRRHLNARNAMMQLLERGIIPVVNENDAVAVDEINFGDNDHLASLVAMLVDADLLLLLTTTNGLRGPGTGGRSKRIAHLPAVDEDALSLTWKGESALSRGGMSSKLQAAGAAADVGIPVIIADGRRPDTMDRALAGADVGTAVGRPRSGARSVSSRKRWIAFFNRAQGTLTVDGGAARALCHGGKSLLPIGVRAVEGTFKEGAVVNVRDPEGVLIARGLASYSSDEILAIQGHRTGEIKDVLGHQPFDEVVHRDNLVVFPPSEAHEESR